MSKTSASVTVDFQLISGFKAVREKLLSLDLTDQWNEPLAYWARPTDRHLPMALIDSTLRSVVDRPFQQLAATPGVGPKKLQSLILLLSRAAEGTTTAASPTANHSHQDDRGAGEATADPAMISEAVWRQWRASLQGQQLEKETLGRFAASLQQLPRAMWQKRLEFYLPLSLREIYALKSHGEKRVTALLEIVGSLHKIVSQLNSRAHLSARIEPRLAARLEDWFSRRLPGCEPLDDSVVCRELFEPLLEQIDIDVGEHAASILRERLLDRRSNTQQTARRLGLTRGRVYEIIAEAVIAIAVRWPSGRQRFMELRDQLARRPEQIAALARVEVALALLFPSRGIELAPDLQLAKRPSNGLLSNGSVRGDISFASPQVLFGVAELEG